MAALSFGVTGGTDIKVMTTILVLQNITDLVAITNKLLTN